MGLTVTGPVQEPVALLSLANRQYITHFSTTILCILFYKSQFPDSASLEVSIHLGCEVCMLIRCRQSSAFGSSVCFVVL